MGYCRLMPRVMCLTCLKLVFNVLLKMKETHEYKRDRRLKGASEQFKHSGAARYCRAKPKASHNPLALE